MRSLLTELDRPAIDAFLSAVDSVMNSNTLLLKARCAGPLNQQGPEAVLGAFLRGASFMEMMVEADRMREWDNLSEYDPETDGYVAREGSLVRGGHVLAWQPLSEAALVERLTWMLCDSFSPYDRHLDRERAGDLVEGFIREVLGRDSGSSAAESGHGDRSESAWSMFSVRPDFLTSTGYYAGESEERLAYFDGGDSDTATLLYRDDLLYLLLTNGSP